LEGRAANPALPVPRCRPVVKPRRNVALNARGETEKQQESGSGVIAAIIYDGRQPCSQQRVGRGLHLDQHPIGREIESKRPAICRETTTESMIGQCRSRHLARNAARRSDWLLEVIMQGCDWVAGTSLEQQPWSITVGISAS
jgi:hypothetical protein